MMVAGSGLVFVCAKNAVRLPQVLRFLQRINAAAYPSIIFDDEADARDAGYYAAGTNIRQG